MTSSYRVVTGTPQSPACCVLQVYSASFDFCGHFLSYWEKNHRKCWDGSVAWLNIRAVLFMEGIILSASRGNTGPCPPDRERQLLWARHRHELCLDKEMVPLISQASSIHSFLPHLGLDIYCIIARTLTEREAAPLTQPMRRSSRNVLAQLLMSKRARSGGCTFLTTNTHFLID